MSFSLDQNRLVGTSLSALSIILGVNLKNSIKFLKKDGQPIVDWLDALSTPLGVLLFVGGWIGIAYNTVLANDDTSALNKTLIVAGVVGIVVGVLFQQMVDDGGALGAVKPWVMGIGFIGGWILLGVVAGLGNNTSMALTLPAALLVLASMTTVLPLQRGDNAMGMNWTSPNGKIVDGPGYPMFVIAWALISLSNSLA